MACGLLICMPGYKTHCLSNFIMTNGPIVKTMCLTLNNNNNELHNL